MHRIIIVGGGAGGLQLATHLGDRLGARRKHPKASIILVDQHATHLWKPLLHSVAAGSLDFSIHQLDYAAQAHWHGFTFQQGKLTQIDRALKTITLAPILDRTGIELLPSRILHYDTLILAIGSITYFFHIPGAEQYTLALDTSAQAEYFRSRLVAACLRAQQSYLTKPSSPTPSGNITRSEIEPHIPLKPQVPIVIIGAGATGVELAAQLRYTAQMLAAYGLHQLDPKHDIRIILIEAAPRILPALPERVSQTTAALLKKLDIEIWVNESVSKAEPTIIHTHSGKQISAELKIWAAGIKAPPVLSTLGDLALNKRGQILVHPNLQSEIDEHIFAMGDCASCPWPGKSGQTVPPRAQAAHQQAHFLVSALIKRLSKKSIPTFRYRDFGSLISLGHSHAVGYLIPGFLNKNLFIEGFLARLMYRALYRMHIAALHGWFYMVLDTLAHWLSRSTRPRVKLH